MSDDKKDELNDLLDDALNDFNKTDAKVANNDKPKAETSNDGSGDASAPGNDDPDAFFMEQAQILADRMNTLFGGPETPSGDLPPMPQDPEKIMAGFKKMAEAAAMTLQGENPANDEEVAKYSDSIAQALRGLQEGSDNLAAPPLDTDVANMLGGLNLEGATEADGNMFLPFMEGMMQSLLSAEILLPSIKELLEKYPKYLEEHGGTLPAEDKERYEKQMELYKAIEVHLEAEKPDDSATVKREKFRIVLEDMRKLQEYGQPPQEILAETAGDLPIFDPNAAAGGSNPQCPMM